MSISEEKELGIIGMGRFGALIYKIFEEDFDVCCYDPIMPKNSDTFNVSTLEYVASRDIVVFCVPILKFEESIIQSEPYIKKDAHILDVLSVKEYPYQIMSRLLPNTVSILPTHPMFGPDSIKRGRKGLPFVLCPEERTEASTFEYFLNYFTNKDFKVIKTSCEDHDKVTAKSLCLTQLLGRVVEKLDITESDYDTANFRNLLTICETARNDSMELFIGLQKFNKYAYEMRKTLSASLNELCEFIENSRY